MLRFVNICLVLGLVALAYVIYEVKYELRSLDEDIAALKKDIEGERDGIAVLRAEWSLLNRPERIERLALKYLKLQPARPTQLVTLDTVSDADFARARSEAVGQDKPLVSHLPTKPAQAKLAKTDAAKPDFAKADGTKTGSIKTGSAKTVAVKTTVVKPASSKKGRSKTAAVKTTVAKTEPAKTSTAVTAAAAGPLAPVTLPSFAD